METSTNIENLINSIPDVATEKAVRAVAKQCGTTRGQK